jgi:hypothetical protein
LILLLSDDKRASLERRDKGEVDESDMGICDSDELPREKMGPAHAEASGPYMRNRFRGKSAVWRGLGACQMVLRWVLSGFMCWFQEEVPVHSQRNQESCFQPDKHKLFIDESMAALKARGVIGVWDPGWGPPRVISPLKVVPKKGDKLRLILDLSWLNRYLRFPKFKYDGVKQIPDLFESGDYMFTWDAKDGYWHVDLHEDMWQYMCFEWEGEILFFAVMPFGLAPACWVFTKMMRVSVNHMRLMGLKVLAYIDDGLGAAQPLARAKRLRDLAVRTLQDCGWMINWAKSDFKLSMCKKEFIGYQVTTESLGSLEPSEGRKTKLVAAVTFALTARTVSPRQVAQATGHIVSLRPCLDPMAMLFTRHLNIWIQNTAEEFGWDWRAALSLEARHELRVWLGWFPKWYSKTLWPGGEPELLMAQDASDQAVGGWLGVFNGEESQLDNKGRQHWVGRVHFEEGVMEAAGRLAQQDLVLSSTYRELYAVFFMIETFSQRLSGKWVRIQADNRSLYFIATKGSSSCLKIHDLLVRLFWLCSEAEIRWDILWLPRELNEWADKLSKDLDEDDWTVHPGFWAVIQRRFGPFDCDMFASGETALLERFCALYWCPGVEYVDCFSRSWSQGRLWWNPNPREVGRVLRKVDSDRATGALLLPMWPGAQWWRHLCPDGRHFSPSVIDWFYLPRKGALVKGLGTGMWNREDPRTDLMVVQLDGSGLGQFMGNHFCAAQGCVDCRSGALLSHH